MRKKNGEQQSFGKSQLMKCPYCYELHYARGIQVHIASHNGIDLGQFVKGQEPWNLGLTSETDSIVKHISNTKVGKKLNLKELNCPQCQKVCIGHGALAQHIRRHHIKDLHIWNLGLTKEKDSRVADYSRKDSIKALKRWNNPDYVAKQMNGMKAIWKDPEFVRKQMKARGVRPNKKEIFLDNLLQENFPNTFKYVGDGEVIICGKCPDYVGIDGDKMIIELYGDYWHRGQNPQDRIDLFKQYGYKTLIIWEVELKDRATVSKRIKEFVGIKETKK